LEEEGDGMGSDCLMGTRLLFKEMKMFWNYTDVMTATTV